MMFARTRAVPVMLLALAAAGIVAVQSPADAAVTTTNIVSPTQGSHYLLVDNTYGGLVTVSGLSNGTTGDFVDIRCYELGSSTYQTGPTGVSVQANGSFTTSMNKNTPYGSCRLRAVPAGYPDGSSISGFTGPVITGEYSYPEKIASGPNAGKTRNFYIAYQSAHALNDYGSATHAGLWDSRLSAVDGSSSNYLWYGGAALSLFEGATRSQLQVDGRDAYGPNSAALLFPNNPGFPSLTFSSSRSASDGSTTITETDPIVRCSASAPFPPTAGTCPTFISTGIRLERTTYAFDGGLQVKVTDKWISTDGKTHTISPYYTQQVQGHDYTVGIDADTPVSLKLPWVGSAFQLFSGDTSYPTPSKVAATIFVRDSDNAADPDTTLPRGSLTFDFPASVRRTSSEHVTLKGVAFTVPAGSSRTIRQVFAMGSSESEIAAKATANEDRINPYRADGQIRPQGYKAFSGNNVYNTDGHLQSGLLTAVRSQTKTYLIAVQNDGTRTQSFRIKGSTGLNGFDTRYLAGVTGSTGISLVSMRDGTYGLHNLAPGEKRYLRLVVTVHSQTAIGKLAYWLVTATPVSDPTRKDVVKAILKVRQPS